MSELSRPLRLPDVEPVRDLVRESFDPKLLPFMTYGQHGIAKFLSNSLRFPLATPEIVRVVVDEQPSSSSVSAFADFRLLDSDIGFLSYICVSPERRGQGIGRQLIREFIAGHAHLTAIQLDVFHDNERARAMYESLGFRTSSVCRWVTRSIDPRSGPDLSIRIPGLPAALAAYDEFGFCEFDAVLPDQSMRLGLMGDVVRCRSLDDLRNDRLLSDLNTIFPHVKTAMAVVPIGDSSLLPESARVLLQSDRMTLNLTSDRSTHKE